MHSFIKYGCFDDGSKIAKITLRNETQNRSPQRSVTWVADIVLEYGMNEDGTCWGRYYSITDYGSAAFPWYHIGKKPFLKFILECAEEDQLYFIKKLFPDDWHCFDLDQSKAVAAERLRELVEENEISEEQEDDFFERLEAINEPHELNEWYADCIGDAEGYESFVYDLSARAGGYMHLVLPLLAEVLKKEGAEDG